MEIIPFWQRFPKVAEAETRVIKLPQATMDLPADEYALVEFYCNKPKCDCRKVILQVWSKQKPGVSLATLNFGWESGDFYVRWLHGDESARILSRLSFEPISPQSPLCRPLMALVEWVLLEDPAYVDRLKRHYQMMKNPAN